MPDELEEFEESVEDFSITETLRIPGALASLAVLSLILLPSLGIISNELGTLIAKAFSVPFLFLFFLEVILNRKIHLKKHLGLLLTFSYVLYLWTNRAVVFEKFVELHYNFAMGVLISVFIMLVYHIFYKFLPKFERFIPGKQKIGPRFSFFLAFIPTIIICLAVLYVISHFGIFSFEMFKPSLNQTLNQIAGG